MTYRSLKTFIKGNQNKHNIKIFDLIAPIKSKIIFVIGDGANNSATYLSSIMQACEISHLRYINDMSVDINRRFLLDGAPISSETLCEKFEEILKKSSKTLSNDDIFIYVSLAACKGEYAIIELSCEYYDLIKNNITPFALVIASSDDKISNHIVNTAPQGVKEIISLSQKEDFDYISSKYNEKGARITLASSNKITVSNADMLGTSFYHYDYLYRVSTIDLNNVPLAHLSIEAASVLFHSPRPYVYSGLTRARLSHDLTLYSLSPTILLREGKNDFKLHHRLKFKVISTQDNLKYPTENTIFCGSKEYIEEIKKYLENR